MKPGVPPERYSSFQNPGSGFFSRTSARYRSSRSVPSFASAHSQVAYVAKHSDRQTSASWRGAAEMPYHWWACSWTTASRFMYVALPAPRYTGRLCGAVPGPSSLTWTKTLPAESNG
ncbi:hypothetical protein Asp14428_16160 [Actinoplanes sp. NBRC 14428]|nr:hypothetical protein Asp14428_16160 [Actinoplanes sp. NBRC 14428]